MRNSAQKSGVVLSHVSDFILEKRISIMIGKRNCTLHFANFILENRSSAPG